MLQIKGIEYQIKDHTDYSTDSSVEVLRLRSRAAISYKTNGLLQSIVNFQYQIAYFLRNIRVFDHWPAFLRMPRFLQFFLLPSSRTLPRVGRYPPSNLNRSWTSPK